MAVIAADDAYPSPLFWPKVFNSETLGPDFGFKTKTFTLDR
jgi:hypothetical protein